VDANKDYCKDAPEMINHPKHYTSLGAKCDKCGSEIECIQISERLSFSLGSALKYIWRCGLKNDAIEELRKSVWYLNREIERRQKENASRDQKSD
jgi:hypothetical protein